MDGVNGSLGQVSHRYLPSGLPRERSEVALDDLAARRCASANGVPVVGTLGLLLRVKRLNLIPAARPLLESLLENGMFLPRDLVESALSVVGE